MKQKITFLFLILLSSTSLVFGQTMVADFEGTETGLLNTGGGITTAVIANPNPTGENTTANCLEIKRTGAQWWILQGIDVDDIAISDTDTKFISMMVHFPAQTDIGVRLDATADDANGTLIVRPLNSYTDFNQWQQMIFEVKDGPDATAFTLGTLFRISFHPDMGFENDPAGQVLNDSDSLGYIDEVQILDSNPLSTSNFEFNNTISLSPNPASNIFKVNTLNNTIIKEISIYNILGKKVNALNIGVNQFDISSLSTGMYMVKIKDSKGSIASKKLFVK